MLLAFAHAEPNAQFELGHVETRAIRDGNEISCWKARRRWCSPRPGGGEAHRLARTSGDPGDTQGVTLLIVEADEEDLGGQELSAFRWHRARSTCDSVA